MFFRVININIPNKYFSINRSTSQNKWIFRMKFKIWNTILSFNCYIRLFRIKFSSKYTPYRNNALMLTPSLMISFSVSDSERWTITRPCYRSNLKYIIILNICVLLFYINFFCTNLILIFWIFSPMIIIKFIIKIIIIITATLTHWILIFTFSFLHIRFNLCFQVFLNGTICFSKIIRILKFKGWLCCFNCIIIPNYIIGIKNMPLNIFN